jgi:flagellar biosynthesis/type III secretory pathway protein FliH
MSSSPSRAEGGPEGLTLQRADERAAFDFAQLAPPPPGSATRRADAASRAAAIVAAAEADAERIRDAARAQGYAEGLEAGRAAARSELQPGLAALADTVAGLRALKAQAVDDVEHHAAELAIHVAERVVAGTVAVEPERILDVIRGALRTIVERERLVIFVNPADLDIVRGGLGELMGLGGIEHVEVQEERRVARGGAVLRTAVGEVDASLETKFERARAAVEQELRG